FLVEIAAIGPTAQRIATVYDVLLPALAARYRRYLNQTDALSDAPTVRILERDLADTTRMVDASCTLREKLPYLRLTDGEWMHALEGGEGGMDWLIASAAGEVAVEL